MIAFSLTSLLIGGLYSQFAVTSIIIVLGCCLAFVQYKALKAEQEVTARHVEALNYEKAKSADKVRYLAKISHDLRTPLHGINGLLEIIECENVSPKVQRYLDQMHISTQALMNVISDVIDLSQTDDKPLELRVHNFRLLDVCENMIRLFSQVADSKQIDLQLHFDSRLFNQFVYSDSQRLYQVLSNLMGNAFKYTDKGKVALWVVFRQKNLQEVDVKFIVADTGIGMSEEELALIFSSFYQVKDSQSGRLEGSGLGLDICKQLVTLFGGELKANSRKHFGTRFEFEITFKQSHQNSHMYIESKKVKNSPVVLVSRRGTMTESIRLFLDANKLEVLHFETIEKAIKASFELTVDLLLLELDVSQSFLKAQELKKVLKPDTACLIVSSAQYQQFDQWQLLYKPVLPSEIIKICIRSGLLKNLISAQLGKIDYAGLLADHISLHSDTKMLIVDDIDINRIVLHEAIKQLGFNNFDFAINGKQAVELCQEKHYDVVWMDFTMPVMSGEEAGQCIRKNGFTGTIIGVTAAVDEEVKLACKQTMNAILTKPVLREQLSKAIYQHLIVPAQSNQENKELSDKLNELRLSLQEHLPVNVLVASEDQRIKNQLSELFAQTQDFTVSFVNKAMDIGMVLQLQSYQILLLDADFSSLSISALMHDMNVKRMDLPTFVLTHSNKNNNAPWLKVFTPVYKPIDKNELCKAMLNKLGDINNEERNRSSKTNPIEPQ